METIKKPLNKNQLRLSFSWEMCGSPIFLLLVILHITFSLVGTVLLYKLVAVGPGLAPGGLFVLPFVLLIEDIIAEVYGYKIARLLIWFLFLSMFVFTASALIIIHLPSPSYWNLQSSFDQVFNPITVAAPSLIAGLFISWFINIYGITKLKILFKGKLFWLRSIASSLIGGLICVFVVFGITYGHSISEENLHRLFLTDIFVRTIYAIFGSGPASLMVQFVKRKEKIDVYDVSTNFNPFKLNIKD